MWLYIPGQTSPSAQVAAGSNWDFDSLCRALERFCTWKGKLRPSRSWSRILKRDSWMTRLSIQMPEPSTVSPGVDEWISSLPVSLVSPTPSLVSGGEPTMIETSGPTLPESSKKSDRVSFSWRMFQRSHGITTTESGQSYEQWATELRKRSLRLRTLARATAGSGSGAWPTVTTDRATRSNGERGPNLIEKATHWRTPRSSESTHLPTTGDNLTVQSKMWQTPGTDSFRARGGIRKGEMGLSNQAKALWTTPTAHDQHSRRNRHAQGGTPLTLQAESVWPTPKVITGGKESVASRKARGSGGEDLQATSEAWPTPQARDVLPTTESDLSRRSPGLPTMASFHPLPTTLMPGHACLPKCRRLNPLFVGWLMNWPMGWTSLEATSSVSSEMASWFSKQRWHLRTLLTGLGLPNGDGEQNEPE